MADPVAPFVRIGVFLLALSVVHTLASFAATAHQITVDRDSASPKGISSLDSRLSAWRAGDYEQQGERVQWSEIDFGPSELDLFSDFYPMWEFDGRASLPDDGAWVEVSRLDEPFYTVRITFDAP